MQREETLPEGPETSGIKVRPAGGAARRKKKKKRSRQPRLLQKTLSRVATRDEDEKRVRPEAQVLQLGGRGPTETFDDDHKSSAESSPEMATTNELKIRLHLLNMIESQTNQLNQSLSSVLHRHPFMNHK